jgi:hypothetical protein
LRPSWHKQPKDYGRPRIEYIRRAELRRVWAYQSGEWTPDMPAKAAVWPTLPDSEHGRQMAFVFAVADLLCQPSQGTREMLARIAPWLDAEGRTKVIERARKYKHAGRGLGKLIGLTDADRRECRAWHLASIDAPEPVERRKTAAGKEAQRRAAKGARTRAEYVESFSGSERSTKPWEALGVHRATYYRFKKAGRLDELRPGACESYNGIIQTAHAPGRTRRQPRFKMGAHTFSGTWREGMSARAKAPIVREFLGSNTPSRGNSQPLFWYPMPSTFNADASIVGHVVRLARIRATATCNLEGRTP